MQGNIGGHYPLPLSPYSNLSILPSAATVTKCTCQEHSQEFLERDGNSDLKCIILGEGLG